MEADRSSTNTSPDTATLASPSLKVAQELREQDQAPTVPLARDLHREV